MDIDALLQRYLDEDVGNGDHSSLGSIQKDQLSSAQLLAKDTGILAGVDVAQRIFNLVDSNVQLQIYVPDGEHIQPGDLLLTIEGSAQSILKGERLMLNCMQRMSGIATHTNQMCSLIAHTQTRLLDTRKTTPGFRPFEKMAVKIGGGLNHRFGLFDMVMLKDNHIDFAGGVKEAIAQTNAYLQQENLPLKIEIECRNLDELDQILSVGNIDRIMLDNFSITNLKKAIQRIDGKYETEASGGITRDTIVSYAECGVDFISVGALTHQVKSLDMSLTALSK